MATTITSILSSSSYTSQNNNEPVAFQHRLLVFFFGLWTCTEIQYFDMTTSKEYRIKNYINCNKSNVVYLTMSRYVGCTTGD